MTKEPHPMSDPATPGPYLTIAQTANYFASKGFPICQRTVANAIARELIVAHKLVGRILVDRASVDFYLANLPRAQIKLPQPRKPPAVVPAAPPPAPEPEHATPASTAVQPRQGRRSPAGAAA